MVQEGSRSAGRKSRVIVRRYSLLKLNHVNLAVTDLEAATHKKKTTNTLQKYRIALTYRRLQSQQRWKLSNNHTDHNNRTTNQHARRDLFVQKDAPAKYTDHRHDIQKHTSLSTGHASNSVDPEHSRDHSSS